MLFLSLLVIGYSLYQTMHPKLASVHTTAVPAQSQTSIPVGAQPGSGTSAVLGAQTQRAGCVARGPLPDSKCTPGALIATATKDQICVSGYSATVRNVSSATKAAVFQEYGIASHVAGQYEVDHLVSLELGGSNDIANLWPEAADPTPGFHEKDVVENYLHSQVCSGAISLAQAQQEVATNWTDVYRSMH